MGWLLAALLSAGGTGDEQQERADLPRSLETWYRVLNGKDRVGSGRETLQRGAAARGFAYALEIDIEGKGKRQELAFTAVLDDELALTEYTANGNTTLTPREDVHVLPTLALYALRQNDTLAKAGRVTLRAAGARDTTVEIQLEVGESVRRDFLGRTVRVTPVTFLKPFPAASSEMEWKEVTVDRYGRVLEATLAGGLRIVVVEGEAEAGADPVRRRGRRDPIDKETAMKNAALERVRERRGEPQVPPFRPTPDTLMSDLVATSKKIEDIRAHLAAGAPEEARKTYLEVLVRLKGIQDLAARIRPERAPEIKAVRDEAELAWPGASHVEREASRRFVQLRELMDELKVEAMEQLHKDLLALRDRIEVEGRPERQAITDLAAKVAPLVTACRARRELAQARLVISGITIGEIQTWEMVDFPLGNHLGVPFVRNFAEAEINGRVYRIGDTIQGTAIRVNRITAHAVQVALRDEARDVPIRK